MSLKTHSVFPLSLSLFLSFSLSLSATIQPNNFADNESNIKPISAAIYKSISLTDKKVGTYISMLEVLSFLCTSQ